MFGGAVGPWALMALHDRLSTIFSSFGPGHESSDFGYSVLALSILPILAGIFAFLQKKESEKRNEIL